MASSYIICSRLTGLALTVEGSNPMPGVRVAPYQRTGDISQQFYDDVATGTIRSSLNHYCLEIEGGEKYLRLMPYRPGDPTQQWQRDNIGCIRNRAFSQKVLEVLFSNPNQGANVGNVDYHGGCSQLWDIHFSGSWIAPPPIGFAGPAIATPMPAPMPVPISMPVPAPMPAPVPVPIPAPMPVPASMPAPVPTAQAPWMRRPFFIVNENNCKVLDAKGGVTIVTKKKKTPVPDYQQWYADKHGYIHSALNDLVIDAASGQKATLKPFNCGITQQWIIKDKKIENESNGECLGVLGDPNKDGAAVGSSQYNGTSNQHWNVTYI